jgi:hypothetical protein
MPAKAGIQQSQGGGYWIARSSRAMTRMNGIDEMRLTAKGLEKNRDA